MNTRLKIVMLCVLGSLCSSIWAQENTFGALPSLNLNKAFKNDWRLNLSIQARNGITERKWEHMAKVCENTPITIALDEELIGIPGKE